MCLDYIVKVKKTPNDYEINTGYKIFNISTTYNGKYVLEPCVIDVHHQYTQCGIRYKCWDDGLELYSNKNGKYPKGFHMYGSIGRIGEAATEDLLCKMVSRRQVLVKIMLHTFGYQGDLPVYVGKYMEILKQSKIYIRSLHFDCGNRCEFKLDLGFTV